MTKNYIDVLKEAFLGTDTLNVEELRKLLAETNLYFTALENTLRTGDEKAKAEAVAEAFAIKEFLDSKSNKPVPFKNLDALAKEEQELLNEIESEMSFQKKAKKTHVKKLKPIKMS